MRRSDRLRGVGFAGMILNYFFLIFDDLGKVLLLIPDASADFANSVDVHFAKLVETP